MCKHCHDSFDRFTGCVIPGAHPHAGRHKTRECNRLNPQQRHGIVGGGGGHHILLNGCDFCHVQGWDPHVQNHQTQNCSDSRNPAGKNFAGVQPCDFCRVHNPGVQPHRTHKCMDSRNLAGKAARGGGVGAPVAGGGGVFCTFCNSTSHTDQACNNPKNLANKPARVAVPVARGGGGAPAATPAYGTIANGQFWNGKGWRQILSIDSRPGGTLVTYRRQDGVSRQVQI